MKILLIEDHKEIAAIIFDFMEIKGYEMDHAYNGQQGYDLASRQHYDLIILDIMLPRMDGLSVCNKLRQNGTDTPILMLTAKDTREDVLAGFAKGADDYLLKPFDLEILDARIKALIRRDRGDIAVKSLTFGELELDLGRHILYRNGRSFSLNPTQFILLKLLIKQAPNVVTKEQMSEAIWGDEAPKADILRGHIYQLRCEIDKPFKQDYIKTVPKAGYRLEEASK